MLTILVSLGLVCSSGVSSIHLLTETLKNLRITAFAGEVMGNVSYFPPEDMSDVELVYTSARKLGFTKQFVRFRELYDAEFLEKNSLELCQPWDAFLVGTNWNKPENSWCYIMHDPVPESDERPSVLCVWKNGKQLTLTAEFAIGHHTIGWDEPLVFRKK